MNLRRGLSSVFILIGILAIIILAGGAYLVFHQNNASFPLPIGSEANSAQNTSPSNDQQSNSQEQVLMNEIGCTDQGSCIAACMKSALTSACAQLQNMMSSGMRAYTQGTPSGPVRSNDVAYVGNNTTANAGALPSCPSNNALFSNSPMSAADLSGIEPMGHLNGEHILPDQADHVYLDGSSSGATPVYAPGNVTLLAVAESVGTSGADAGTNNVKLYFSPCKSLMFAFQINTLSPRLVQALSTLTPASIDQGATVKNTVYGPLSIPLTSGEELGTVLPYQGQPGGADFAVADVRTTSLSFIDQGEATGMLADSYLHTVCPLDYFTSTVRSDLSAALTVQNAGANGIPACGSTMQDKSGTAQGNWYHKGDTASYQGIVESSLLGLVHSNLDPAKGVVSAGTDLIPSPYLGSQLIFTPQGSGYINRDPSQITADGNIYCFEGAVGAGGHGNEGHVDVRMDSAAKLEADYAAGMCAQSPTFSSNTVVYER
ncbi:MAG: hypothetical protein KGH93_02630 [Patescibacteria group bacterium]|nr:hypothetical protein [Patescibacteria group bacterium]MDE1946070.1 hypothetical protein [Patescibacteria group bacterium]